MFRRKVQGNKPALISHLIKHLNAVIALNSETLPDPPRGAKHHHESLLYYLTEVQTALYGTADAPATRESISELSRLFTEATMSPPVDGAPPPPTLLQALVASMPLLTDEECGILTQCVCFFFKATASGTPEHPQAVAQFRAPLSLADLGLSREILQIGDSALGSNAVGLLLAFNSEGRPPALLLNASRCIHESLKFSVIAAELLAVDAPVRFLKQLLSPSFDVSSSASTCLSDLVAGGRATDDPAWHQEITEWLLSHYDEFFGAGTRVLESVETNYLACREMLRLIGALLFVPANKCVIVRWVSETENLKLMMRLLLNKNSFIQLEAFHLFKLFVANPRKPAPIVRLLARNRDKLLTFFESFAPAKESHLEDFLKDRALVISIISDLKASDAE